jgi:drug/metabolite transporter (DMT)-like permease
VTRATLSIIASAAAFGSVSTFVLLATRAGAALPTVLFWRYVLGAVFLTIAAGGPIALWRGRPLAPRVIVIGGAFQAAIAFTSLSALRWVSAATLAFLFYTYPAWVALLAMLRRTERVDGRRLTALALALSGIVLTVGAPQTSALPLPGVALALAAAIIYALFLPIVIRLQGDLAPAVAAVYVVVGAGTLFGVGSAAAGVFTARMAPAAWAATGGLALVSTSVGFITLLYGLRRLGPVRTAIVSTVEPFWTAILGAVVLGQPMTTPTLFGGGLIAAAVVLLQWRGRAVA